MRGFNKTMMTLVEQHMIKPSNPLYGELATACSLSKNLYNQALYRVRQHFFNTKGYLNKYALTKEMTKEQQIDYTSLPRKVSQQVIGMVDQNFRSFFGSLKTKKVDHKVSIPKYLGKRIKRGLFRSSNGRLVNADLNGALNILRKEVPNAFGYGIEVCSTPSVLTVK